MWQLVEADYMEISLKNSDAEGRTTARHQNPARDSSSCYQTVSKGRGTQALNNPQHE
jgi:hypothetical protein